MTSHGGKVGRPQKALSAKRLYVAGGSVGSKWIVTCLDSAKARSLCAIGSLKKRALAAEPNISPTQLEPLRGRERIRIEGVKVLKRFARKRLSGPSLAQRIGLLPHFACLLTAELLIALAPSPLPSDFLPIIWRPPLSFHKL